jgi:glycosidase
MADLNQNNPLLAEYLIQNSIWWIETGGLSGIRMDTEVYPFKDFMTKWANRVHEEYPDFTLLGETWVQYVPFVAFFEGNGKISGDFNSGLNSVTDFPLYFAIKDALNQKDTWTEGLLRLYYILGQDFLYNNPNNNTIFIDNHDVDRYFTAVGENFDKFKTGIVLLFTLRGIPVMQFGTEILMVGREYEGHGKMRKDFPGGWVGDKSDAFTSKGRTAQQNEAFDFVQKIALWRKGNSTVSCGKFLHFIPENNVYVYFRYNDSSAVMILINNHDTEERTVDCSRFAEILSKYSKGKEIISGKEISDLKSIKIAKKSALIIELMH